jgi:hypothetical protein
MRSVARNLGQILNLALVFAFTYLLGETFGYAFGLAPGIFPFAIAAGVTLVVGGAWQWRRSSPPTAT